MIGRRHLGEVVVVVPAADEADRIGACLDALAVAADRVDPSVRVRTVVVLDGCTDGTAEVVALRRDVEQVVSGARQVGTARALGAAHAIAQCVGPAATLLASTDADSRVPADWLRVLLELAAGADVVAGTVVPDHELAPPGRRVWDRLHDSADGHPHVHGANLAIRVPTYLQLGGWSALPSGEDEDLVLRAVAAGTTVVRTGRVPVLTSARRTGRAPHGFSSYLRAIQAG